MERQKTFAEYYSKLPRDIECLNFSYLTNYEDIQKLIEHYSQYKQEKRIYNCIREILRTRSLYERETISLREVIKFPNLERITLPILLDDDIDDSQINILKQLLNRFNLKEIVLIHHPSSGEKAGILVYKNIIDVIPKNLKITIYVDSRHEKAEELIPKIDWDHNYEYACLEYSYDPETDIYSYFDIRTLNDNLRSQIKKVRLTTRNYIMFQHNIFLLPNVEEFTIIFYSYYNVSRNKIRYDETKIPELRNILQSKLSITTFRIDLPPSFLNPNNFYQRALNFTNLFGDETLSQFSYVRISRPFNFKVILQDHHLVNYIHIFSNPRTIYLLLTEEFFPTRKGELLNILDILIENKTFIRIYGFVNYLKEIRERYLDYPDIENLLELVAVR